MEVGTEISQKIRSAIKAKLLELGSYVDDELPDYIMVMVANKKSRTQMNSDLGLFLGSSTVTFTDWLHGLLEKLQTITVEPETCSDKQDKSEKSKDKKRDKKSHRGDASSSRRHRDKDQKDKKKEREDVGNENKIVVSGVETTSPSRKSESQDEARSDSVDDIHKEHVIQRPVDGDRANLVSDDRQVGEKRKSITNEDVEDVRQLLVTEAAEDELTTELETTEVEIVHARTVRGSAKPAATSSNDVARTSTDQLAVTKKQSPERRSVHKVSEVSRKRRAPTSIVAAVSQKEEDEEYDPHNPAVGSVASVVRVTARKSSVPPLLQANRLLLIKAMTEAERSVAEKKKAAAAATKPFSRDNSPSEVYSPKRKRSDRSREQESPPPYIPSKKNSIRRQAGSSVSQSGDIRVLSRNDARHMINRDSGRELTLRSYREVVRGDGGDRDSEHQVKMSRSPERGREQKEEGKNVREVKSDKSIREEKSDKNIREVRSDRSMGGDKNIQITCHLTFDSGSAVSQVDKKRQHSPSPEPKKPLKVTVYPLQSAKPTAARLGKIVVDRNNSSDDEQENVSTRERHSVTSTTQRDARDDIVAKATRSESNEGLYQRDARADIVAKATRSESNEGLYQRDARADIVAKATRSESKEGYYQRDARADIIAKATRSESKEKLFKKLSGSGPVISSVGKEAVQKQCEAAVISVQAAQSSSRAKRNMSPDSRVVECDTQSPEDVRGEESLQQREEVVEAKGTLHRQPTPNRQPGTDQRPSSDRWSSTDRQPGTDQQPSSDRQPSTDRRPTSDRRHSTNRRHSSDGAVQTRNPENGDDDDDDDDLAKMIDEDLGPELLNDTNEDDFNLDLDIDDDLSKVAGITEDETANSAVCENVKADKKRGTRFIVTLDGVDERQFRGENSCGIFEKLKASPAVSLPTVTAPVGASSTQQLQPAHSQYLSLVGAHSKPVAQAFLQHVQTPAVAVASKLTPPKIQPFSISLKDSDDEHDDKELKSVITQEDYYQQPEGEVSAVKRAKMSERCKFWPACAVGAACEYHHPTAHCKTFPGCKFGDKCLFIHPNCRFDSKCTRPDCPYTHTSRRPAVASATHVIAIPKSHFVFSTVPPKASFRGQASSPGMCRYFPNCHNMNCTFLHPKACKFGTTCMSPACPFYHPQVPGKDKLKWQASSLQTRTEPMTVPAPPASAKVEDTVDKSSPNATNNSATVSSTSQ